MVYQQQTDKNNRLEYNDVHKTVKGDYKDNMYYVNFQKFSCQVGTFEQLGVRAKLRTQFFGIPGARASTLTPAPMNSAICLGHFNIEDIYILLNIVIKQELINVEGWAWRLPI